MSHNSPSARGGTNRGLGLLPNQEADCDMLLEGHMEEAKSAVRHAELRKRADPWKIDGFGNRDADSEAEEKCIEWGEVMT